MRSGAIHHIFGLVAVAASIAASSSVANAYSDVGRGGLPFFRDCSKIPTENGVWVADCSLRYTESGQFLVNKLYRREQMRDSGSRSFLSIEKDIHLYLK